MIACAAPAVFPMPFHRSLDVVDAEEVKIDRLRKGNAETKARRAK